MTEASERVEVSEVSTRDTRKLGYTEFNYGLKSLIDSGGLPWMLLIRVSVSG